MTAKYEVCKYEQSGALRGNVYPINTVDNVLFTRKPDALALAREMNRRNNIPADAETIYAAVKISTGEII